MEKNHPRAQTSSFRWANRGKSTNKKKTTEKISLQVSLHVRSIYRCLNTGGRIDKVYAKAIETSYGSFQYHMSR